MLGWNISVYRQTDGGSSPAEADSEEGVRLATWQPMALDYELKETCHERAHELPKIT